MGANLNKGSLDLALAGEYEFRVTWRVEQKGGLFRRKIDLNAIGMVANAGFEWIGAVHNKDPRPFDGALRYGGDTNAKSGGEASESIYINLADLVKDPDAMHAVFAVTCFGNPLALGELAELRFQLFDPNGKSMLSGGRRSIQEAASAALAVRLDIAGAQFVEVSDHFNVDASATKWRQLAAPSTAVIRRAA